MSEFRAGEILGDRFEVVGVLGHGGMATVYLVDDRLRGQAVALKVLHPEFAASLGSARFRREIDQHAQGWHPSCWRLRRHSDPGLGSKHHQKKNQDGAAGHDQRKIL